MRALVLAAILGGAPEVPTPLACLARYYALTPEQVDGFWYGRLPDGARIPWNDGKTKTDEERFEHPDLHDMLIEPYPRGPIRAITKVDADPGRMRVDALFLATYGASGPEIRRKLVSMDFLGERVRVHSRVVSAFDRAAKQLAPLIDRNPSIRPLFRNLGGTFNWRPIAGGDKLSSHSFGVSIDLNAQHTAYWQWQKPPEPIRWRNNVPQTVVDAFEVAGFIWGGRWYHYDTMHFEYRPELLDPECQIPVAGVPPTTSAGRGGAGDGGPEEPFR